jgi:hypothetical protein
LALPSSSITILPSYLPNSPRTVEMPRCLTLKPMRECAGSTFQVPVGSEVVVALMGVS